MTMGAQIPVIAEKPLTACGCRKFQLDDMGDNLCTCTTHSGVKKAHDWVVDQLIDLFHIDLVLSIHNKEGYCIQKPTLPTPTILTFTCTGP